MRLYHRTDASEAIVRRGFRDATGSYALVGFTLTGVFLSDVPIDCNEGAKGEDLLVVELPDVLDLSKYEIVDESGMSRYREWCIPASLLNACGTARLLTVEEEMQIPWAPDNPIADQQTLDLPRELAT